MNNDIFREKLLNGKFTEEELEDLAWCELEADIKFINNEEGECHRWTQDMATIFEFEDKYYCLNWDRGLTELQENSFYNQPYEVEKEIKVVETITWKRVS